MRLADVVERAKRSVVRVEAKQVFGTGVFVAPHMVLTNAHVVGKSVRIRLTDLEESSWAGTVAWKGDAVDLAVVKSVKRDLPNLPVGDLKTVREGDDVIALGHPLGLNFTITRGIISCKSRKIDDQTYLQTSNSRARLKRRKLGPLERSVS